DSTTTFGSGGYSFALGPGTYTVSASGGGLAMPIIRQVTVGTQNVRLNFLDKDDGYIVKLYQTVLGRTPAPVEVSGWETYLQNGGSLMALPSILEHSPEREGSLIRSWYATFLGRQAGPSEVQAWINAMQQGMTQEQVQAAILASDEFFQRAASLYP